MSTKAERARRQAQSDRDKQRNRQAESDLNNWIIRQNALKLEEKSRQEAMSTGWGGLHNSSASEAGAKKDTLLDGISRLACIIVDHS